MGANFSPAKTTPEHQPPHFKNNPNLESTQRWHLPRRQRRPLTPSTRALRLLGSQERSPWDTSLPSRPSVLARPSWSSSPVTLLLFARVSLSTTPCCPRPTSTTSAETTYVHTQSPLSYHEACLILNDQTFRLRETCLTISLPDFGGPFTYFFFFLQIELGTACGKLYRCSTMAILDGGDSDILSSQAE